MLIYLIDYILFQYIGTACKAKAQVIYLDKERLPHIRIFHMRKFIDFNTNLLSLKKLS